MGCARQRDSIANIIGTLVFDGFDMRSLDLRPATAIDEFEAGHGAATIVSLKHEATENAIANGTRAVVADTVPLYVEKGCRLFSNTFHRSGTSARE